MVCKKHTSVCYSFTWESTLFGHLFGFELQILLRIKQFLFFHLGFFLVRILESVISTQTSKLCRPVSFTLEQQMLEEKPVKPCPSHLLYVAFSKQDSWPGTLELLARYFRDKVLQNFCFVLCLSGSICFNDHLRE